ncbi:hypothetical protein AB0N81_01965 [Streptomyces sp. NPDC093510]|uniref:hypothetical protein n=1 Tax=Streptomyces sp. NPDC093510 TaxID=3155199 RepID=UPI00341B42BD
MPFPTSDMLAAFGTYIRFQSLGKTLAERHPELAHRIEVAETAPLYLKVDLDGKRGVLLAHVRFPYTIMWRLGLTGPGLTAAASVLPLDTSEEALADAVHAHTTAHLTGAPVPSPWRWHENEHSDLTELADLLDAQGVVVRRVAAGNIYSLRDPYYAPELVTPSHRDPHVDATVDGHELRISLKPRLGWVIDLWCSEVDLWTRVDINRSLGRPLSPVPGVPRADLSVAELAKLIGAGHPAWESEDVGSIEDDDSAADPTRPGIGYEELFLTVLGQLGTFGFTDVYEGDAENPLRSTHFHIALHSAQKDLSAPALKALNGEAAAAGDDVLKRLMVITRAGLSKPAAVFADQAKAFVFQLDERTGRLAGLHARAREVLLPRDKPDFQ